MAMSTMNLLLCFVLLAMVEFSYSFSSVSTRSTVQTRLQLEMKGKGKRVPIDQRGEFIKRQRILEAQAQIEKSKPSGVPIFKVRKRTVP